MEKRKIQTVIFHKASDGTKQVLTLKVNQSRGLFWQNVTGSVEREESYLRAAIRESVEETGITEDNILLIRKLSLEFKFTDRWQKSVLEKVFAIEALHSWDVVIDPKEHLDFRWVKESEITPEVVYFKSNYDAIMEALK